MRKTILASTAAALLAFAPSALAADYNATLNASTPAFAWNGGPGTSVAANLPELGGFGAGTIAGCTDGIADCEDALFKVELPGTLTVTATADDPSTDALDLYLYKSDEKGTYEDGDLITSDEDISKDHEGASEKSDEKITVAVEPGWYAAQIRFFDASADTYKGTAKLSGFPAPAAPAQAVTEQTQTQAQAPSTSGSNPPASQPAQSKPAAKPKASKKAACQKKAKKIKNKAKRKKALKKCAKVKG